MEPLSANNIHRSMGADERLLQLKLQAQEDVVRCKGSIVETLWHARHLSLASSLVQNAAFNTQQLLPTPAALDTKKCPKVQSGAATGNLQLQSIVSVAQQRWQKLVTERLHAAQMLLPDVPLVAVARDIQDLAAMRTQVSDHNMAWERIGSSTSHIVAKCQASSASRLLYDAEDLLQAVTTTLTVGLQGADDDAGVSVDSGGQQQQQTISTSLLRSVHAPNRTWLQSFFADLALDRRQVGVDDVLHAWFREQQVQQAHRTAESCSAAACRAAARTGLPPSARPWVWATALGMHAAPPSSIFTSAGSQHQPAPDVWHRESNSSDTPQPAPACTSAPVLPAGSLCDWWTIPSQRDQQLLQLLCEAVEQQTLLTDVLTCADVQRLADDGHYFVYEEMIRALLLAFSRDSFVSRTAAVPAAPRLAAEIKNGQQLRLYPTSGVLPFQGLASLLAPLCYVYEHPAAAYKVFVAMYCRFWCRLHTLTAQPAPAAGLPVLCSTFCHLLQEVDLEVYNQLSRLAASPLDLAAPWIISGFVTYLSPSETLLLWDRIIGFDSLLVLPVLAVAVMTFRRDLVLAAQSSDELMEVLEDLSQIRVVPLLQALLFDS